MLADVVEYLRCPHCEAALRASGGALSCERAHSFDIARQGYVSMLGGDAGPGTADTGEMVAAREAFLSAGHLRPVADAVASECRRVAAGTRAGAIVDLGGGTGYFLAAALERLPGRRGLALDISKHAARRAARAHPRAGAVVCDAWRPLPVRTGAAAVLLSVLSPRNGPEMRRVLREDGALVLVTPTRDHLHELVAAIGLVTVDERKEERLEERLGGLFRRERASACELRLLLERPDLERLVAMGPSARHIDAAAARERIAALSVPSAVTVALAVSVYRPRGDAQGAA